MPTFHTPFLSLCLRFVLALYFATAIAYAHGVPTPKHGGLVDIGGEVSFEMLVKGNAVTIHIEDHGKPVSTKGATGELLLGSETGQRLASLKESGSNSLYGISKKFKRTDRLFVRATLGDGSIVVGEFLIR